MNKKLQHKILLEQNFVSFQFSSHYQLQAKATGEKRRSGEEVEAQLHVIQCTFYKLLPPITVSR